MSVTLPRVDDHRSAPTAGPGNVLDGWPMPAGGRWQQPVVLSGAEVRGDDWLDRFDAEDRAPLAAALVSVAQSARGVIVEARGRRAGQYFEVLVTPGETANGVTVAVVDVSARRRREQRLEFEATHDPLTGLLNRAGLADRLEHALSRRDQDPSVLAVLFVDLSGFKSVNDRYGHRGGDRVLQAVAERALRVARPDDGVARLGGDEFVVVCEALSAPSEARDMASRLQALIGAPVPMDEDILQVVATVGVAFAGPPGEAPAALVDRADRAMYEARGGAATGPRPQPGTGGPRDRSGTASKDRSGRAVAPVRGRLVAAQSELARQWALAMASGDAAAANRWQSACRAVRRALAALDGETLL